mgnify:CR=1 FL=1|tara:strand:+ start:683 stop:886 length:204 start_codon:yes stop_codon:yes gene_type:complete
MNKKILNIVVFIIVSTILLYFARNNYKEFNLKKAVSACILAQKQKSQSFDKDVVKKECEAKINKLGN